MGLGSWRLWVALRCAAAIGCALAGAGALEAEPAKQPVATIDNYQFERGEDHRED